VKASKVSQVSTRSSLHESRAAAKGGSPREKGRNDTARKTWKAKEPADGKRGEGADAVEATTSAPSTNARPDRGKNQNRLKHAAKEEGVPDAEAIVVGEGDVGHNGSANNAGDEERPAGSTDAASVATTSAGSPTGGAVASTDATAASTPTTGPVADPFGDCKYKFTRIVSPPQALLAAERPRKNCCQADAVGFPALESTSSCVLRPFPYERFDDEATDQPRTFVWKGEAFSVPVLPIGSASPEGPKSLTTSKVARGTNWNKVRSKVMRGSMAPTNK